jgi:hypothetical protein
MSAAKKSPPKTSATKKPPPKASAAKKKRPPRPRPQPNGGEEFYELRLYVAGQSTKSTSTIANQAVSRLRPL